MGPERTLIIFAKAPRPGRVKTRLGRGIGMVAACWWFRHQTRRLVRRLSDPRWRLVLAVAPDTDLTSSLLPTGTERWPQGGGDLGARMARALATAPGPAVVIGADIPEIEASDIADAFKALGQADVVIGPADDGGYWLIGLGRRAAPSGFLESVRWSTEHALGDSLATMDALRVMQLRTLRDVDEATDL